MVTAHGPRLTTLDFFKTAETSKAEATDLRSVARTAAQGAERVRIEQALHDAGGNRVKAAKLLRISRASLYNKLRSYDIH